MTNKKSLASSTLEGGKKTTAHQQEGYKSVCAKCGATRIDAQIGLESTPAAYVANIVAVMRECWRVLKDDGVLWLNLGDSYAGANNGYSGDDRPSNQSGSLSSKNGGERENGQRRRLGNGLKPKDLCGIPWRVAFALQDDGWYLRSDIIWHKPNPMPESVTDRPTKAHEYVFLLTKQARYYYDAEAIKEVSEESSGWSKQRANGKNTWEYNDTNERIAQTGQRIESSTLGTIGTRNRRSVWTVATSPYSGAKEIADYAGDDGKPYRASPDCPIHGHLARVQKSYTAGYDEPLNQKSRRTADIDYDLESTPVSLQSATIYHSESDGPDGNVLMQNLESTADYKNEVDRPGCTSLAQTVDRTNRTSKSDETLDHTSGLPRREYDPSAIGRSKRKNKTSRARQSSERDNASSQIHGHKQGMLPIDEHTDSDDHIDENNSAEGYASGEKPIDPLVQKISRIARIDSSFDTSHMRLYCTCQVVSTDHFATFPPALIEPMILAGTSARGECPHCGKAWVRVVETKREHGLSEVAFPKSDGADSTFRLHRRLKAARDAGEPHDNALGGSDTIGWRPACACYAVPPLPDEPEDVNGNMAAYKAEQRRVLDLYATLPTVPQLVLDPFAGTATVGRVCAKRGRQFIGTELNLKYIDLADERTSSVQQVML